MNAVIGGAIECLANCLTIPLLLYLGRRWPTAIAYFISGVSLLLVIFVPEGHSLLDDFHLYL